MIHSWRHLHVQRDVQRWNVLDTCFNINVIEFHITPTKLFLCSFSSRQEKVRHTEKVRNVGPVVVCCCWILSSQKVCHSSRKEGPSKSLSYGGGEDHPTAENLRCGSSYLLWSNVGLWEQQTISPLEKVFGFKSMAVNLHAGVYYLWLWGAPVDLLLWPFLRPIK